MTANHTQGRLVAGLYRVAELSHTSTFHGVGVVGGDVPIAVTGPTEAMDAPVSIEDARRLAACWNACEGFSTGTLERDTFMESLRKSSDTIRKMSAQLFAFHAERDQLRAELDAARALLGEVAGKGEYDIVDPDHRDSDGRQGIEFTDDFKGIVERIRALMDADCAAGNRAAMKRFPLATVAERAQYLVDEAAAAGVVLTVEQRPRAPLAMGNYDTVISVRAARERAQ